VRVQGAAVSRCVDVPSNSGSALSLRLRLDSWELLPPLPSPSPSPTQEAGTVLGGEGEPGLAWLDEQELDVDAGVVPELDAWLSVRGARKLLCEGVGLEAVGELHLGPAADGPARLRVSSLRLLVALPEPAFVARALRLAPTPLAALLCGVPEAPPARVAICLAGALQPGTVGQCEALRALLVATPPDAPVFKLAELQTLCGAMRTAQGWYSSKGNAQLAALRPPRARTWEAVLRLEELWGPAARLRSGADYGCGTGTAVGVGAAGGAASAAEMDSEWLLGRAEPMLHIPVGEETRSKSLSRRGYVTDRKRPQVVWMLGLLRALGRRILAERERRGSVGAEAAASSGKQEGSGVAGPRSPPLPLRLVDIGGGRGDLALAIAGCLGPSLRLPGVDGQQHAVAVHVLVLDINALSLAQGEKRAREAGLIPSRGVGGNGACSLEFMQCDVSDSAAVTSCLEARSYASLSRHGLGEEGKREDAGGDGRGASLGVDLVVGIHCCGGLTEAALGLALERRAGWAVCSCCFNSHPQLATLSCDADAMAATIAASATGATAAAQDGHGLALAASLSLAAAVVAEGEGVAGHGSGHDGAAAAGHAADRQLVCALAQATEFHGQHRAQRAINALRLAVCDARAAQSCPSPPSLFKRKLQAAEELSLETWLLEFPVSYSKQNSVLVGSVTGAPASTYDMSGGDDD
jgi:hypothetical protein